MVPYINPANQADGVQTGHEPGVICLYRALYINPANQAPGVKIGHAPGVISSHRLVMGKT